MIEKFRVSPEQLPFVDLRHSRLFEILQEIISAIEDKQLQNQASLVYFALKNSEVKETGSLLAAWNEALQAGRSSTLTKTALSEIDDEDTRRIIEYLLKYHPHAPIDQHGLLGTMAAISRGVQGPLHDYFKRRWNRLCQSNISDELLSLLAIEMSSFTTLHAALKPLDKILDPKRKIVSWPNAESDLTAQLAHLYFALGVQNEAQNYLDMTEHTAALHPDENLPHPLFAWKAVLHAAKNNDRRYRLDDALAVCFTLLAEHKYEEFFTQVAAIQKLYPGFISTKYIEKAKGLA